MHSKLSKEHYVMDILVYTIDFFLFMKHWSGSTNAFSIYEYLEVSPSKYLLRLRDFNDSPRNWSQNFLSAILVFLIILFKISGFPAGSYLNSQLAP